MPGTKDNDTFSCKLHQEHTNLIEKEGSKGDENTINLELTPIFIKLYTKINK